MKSGDPNRKSTKETPASSALNTAEKFSAAKVRNLLANQTSPLVCDPLILSNDEESNRVRVLIFYLESSKSKLHTSERDFIQQKNAKPVRKILLTDDIGSFKALTFGENIDKYQFATLEPENVS